MIGLMMAVLYNTVQQPKERDTRDIWAIREALTDEKQRHSKLLADIRTLNEAMKRYDTAAQDNPEQALKDTILQLQQQAGLAPYTGPGIVVKVEPAPDVIMTGKVLKPLAPELLMQLTNYLFQWQALAITIDGQRLVINSAIRDLNGKTSVNGEAISTPPITIQIATATEADATKIKNKLMASTLGDSFFLDGWLINIDEPTTELKLDAWQGPLVNDYLIESNKGDN